MGHPEMKAQDLAAANDAGIEGEEGVRWNPLKTIALVTVSNNGYVLVMMMSLQTL